MEFQKFVGIDWSGAKGKNHKGISLAINNVNQKKIQLVKSKKTNWSREEVLKFILNLSSTSKTLVGIDFAFSHPYNDKGFYYPGGPNDQPRAYKQLWEKIDNLSLYTEDFYGGRIWKHPVYGEYYNSPFKKGNLFLYRRRLTEIYAKKILSPSSSFNCVGPSGVGTGSLSGMRVLNYLKSNFNNEIGIWPFDHSKTYKNSRMVIVEIFPSLYFHYAGFSSKNKHGKEKKLLRNVLSFYNSTYNGSLNNNTKDNDDMDAIVSCAALKYFNDKGFFNKIYNNLQLKNSLKKEGWIFGVE